MGKQSRDVAVAFAGSGASSPENTTALLNDFFGFGPEDEEGYPEVPEGLDLCILLPASETHATDSVMGVFDWTEYADLNYEVVVDKETREAKKQSKDIKSLLKYANTGADDPVTDINRVMIESLQGAKSDGSEVYLFLFWGEEGDENAEVLLDLATTAGIPVKDVTAGLDDLSFDDPEESATEEPEPELEPEERPRRGRRRQQEESKPLEDKEPEPEPEPEEPPKRRGRARKAEPEPDLQEQVAEAHAKRKQELADGANKTAEDMDEVALASGGKDEIFVRALEIKHEAKARTIKPEVIEKFSAFPASPEIAAFEEALRRVAVDYAHYLNELLPDSREKSLALTKVEEAHLWAREWVVRHAYKHFTQEAQEAQEQPSRGRGRPRKDGEPTRTRTAAEKAVTEIWDEDEEKWVRKGRGRVPKGVKTRLVDPKTGDVIED